MALDTSARHLLWLAPDWARPDSWLPALAAYVALAEPADDVCLCLDAADGPVPPLVVLDQVQGACDALSGGARLEDVLILDEPEDRPAHARRVTDAASVADALGRALPPAPTEPVAIAAHARWAKPIFDAVRDRFDRHRFDTTPEPSWDDPEPLVTVSIPTYGDVEALMTRTLPSVLNGAWANVEVLVCSDGPQPHARAAVSAVQDPRVRYLELPERIPYPSHFHSFWQVAGAHPVNATMAAARGAFLCPLDHDDAFTNDHIRVLLQSARAARADFTWGQSFYETRRGPWQIVGSTPLAIGTAPHSAVLQSRRLFHLHADAEAWVLNEPGDWNMWRRCAAVGAGLAFLPKPVVAHFKERTSIEDDPAAQGRLEEDHIEPPIEDFAADVLSTGACRLLGLVRRVGVPALA